VLEGLKFANSQIKAIQDYYNHIVNAYDQKWGAFYLDQLLKDFINYLNPSSDNITILDIGCGPGRDSVYFSSQSFSTVAFDLSDQMLEIVKREAIATNVWTRIWPVCGDMRTVPFQDNVFHGIWCCASLLFIPIMMWELVLAEFYRILKRQGILFLAVKNIWNPKHFGLSIYSKLRNQKRKFGEILFSNQIYTAFTNPRSIINLLNKRGFKLLGSEIGIKWINLYVSK